jgi:hypothetical protein
MGLKLSDDDEPPPPRFGPANALQELEHLELKLFCDFKGAPRIALPADPPTTSWPIRHSRVDEWLAAWYFRFCNHVLNKWERERILAVLCGQAQAAPASSPSDAELWIEFEREPVALEVLEFMESRKYKPYEGSMSSLHKLLDDRLVRQKITHRDWPKKPNILSCKLKRLSPGLAKAGLLVEIKHTKKGSHVTLTWQRQKHGGDDGEHPPSPPSSPDKPNPEDILPCVDAGDAGPNTSLTHRLRQKKEKHNETNCKGHSGLESNGPERGDGQ